MAPSAWPKQQTLGSGYITTGYYTWMDGLEFTFESIWQLIFKLWLTRTVDNLIDCLLIAALMRFGKINL